jgi:tetratricopeptide (TPR) repeat protein
MVRKRIAAGFSLIVLTLTSLAQDPFFDSLKTILAKTKTIDTNYVLQLDNLSWNYKLYNEFDSALKYGELTVKYAEQINYPTGIAVGYIDQGLAYNYKSNYLASMNAYNKALDIYKQINNRSGIAACYNNMGSNMRVQGRLREALEFHFKALRI